MLQIYDDFSCMNLFYVKLRVLCECKNKFPADAFIKEKKSSSVLNGICQVKLTLPESFNNNYTYEFRIQASEGVRVRICENSSGYSHTLYS